MSAIRHFLATSDHPVAVKARVVRRAWRGVSLPLPPLVTVPYRMLYNAGREVIYEFRRVFIADPIFRSYCASIGRGFRTGIYVHWLEGKGNIIIGDDVTLDGKISFHFASRYTDRPTLRFGNRSGVSHGCTFIVARGITIGEDVRIAVDVTFRDSPGHPIDPEARRRGEPPPADAIQPIVIEDNVWIGAEAIILGGVTIGTGSVISTGAVVMSSFPANSLVAGNPARRIGVTTSSPSPAPAGSPS